MEEKIIPVRADQTTPQTPWTISRVAQNFKNYICQLPSFWVEAEIVEYNYRPGTNIAFIVLRDLKEKTSIQAYAFSSTLDKTSQNIQTSAKIVALVKPNFWQNRGTLTLEIKEIKVDGIGEILLKIEQLRKQLEKEGLFDSDRKKSLPFIPKKIGLICGRQAKAKHDVLENTFLRWNANFEIREVAVQGQKCVTEVLQALEELQQDKDIQVIVIARGGGSVEDLLPFSDEKLVRTVAQCEIPIVSAIGHETDCPLLDFVADYRASTPTDAAMNIVPSFAEEKELIEKANTTLCTRIQMIMSKEKQLFENLANRPCLINPKNIIEKQEILIDQHIYALRTQAQKCIQLQTQKIMSLDAKIQALSPKSTMQRGYSITTDSQGVIIKSLKQVNENQDINLHFYDGHTKAQIKK